MSCTDKHEASLTGILLRGFLSVAVVLVLAAPAWAQLGQGRMRGTVTDPQGNPIEGVEVIAHNPEVSPSTLETTTEADGSWALLGFNQATWTFTFRKEGYVEVRMSRPVKMLARNPELEVTLEPLESEVTRVEGGTDTELFDEGADLFQAEDYAGAVAKWEEFLAQNPEIYQVHENIGVAYRRMGDLEAAQEHLGKVLEQEPDNIRANTTMGEILVEQGEAQAALPYFEHVVEAAQDDPAVFYNVGEIYFEAGNGAQAIDYYRQAVEIDPEFLPAYQQMGYAYVNSGDMDNAIAAFEKYLELAPEGSQEAATVQGILEALRSSQ